MDDKEQKFKTYRSLSDMHRFRLRLFAEGFLVTEIAKKLNRSIKTISSQKKSAMMKLGVENDIALLNYLSSVTLSPADKD